MHTYGISESILTDNGPKFIAQFFRYVCAVLQIHRIPIMVYHPQCNGQTERYNKSIAARLRHYVSDHQNAWDLYFQPLTYS